MSNYQLASFAAGCFWGVQFAFDAIPGVVETKVGYMGGQTPNPSYKDVCTDTTGHAETLQIYFDPDKVSYKTLLNKFWELHDPTQLNRQGPDFGTQYRSVIFYHNEEQRAIAEQSRIEIQPNYSDPVVTQVVPATQFYEAEEYHQKYFEKQGRSH